MKQGLAAGCLAAVGGGDLAHGDFSRPYAPENWTFKTEAGGYIQKHTDDTLVLIGGDSGLFGHTDIVTSVIANGVWSFSWMYTRTDTTSAVDFGFYLINGEEFFLADTVFGNPIYGSRTVAVRTGDMIGFRVFAWDGVFGPGVLTITDFFAPVPAPAASLLLLGFGLRPSRQRRTDPP